MSALISAILDLVKYQIIKTVDTGDKTFDSLIVVLLTIILTITVNWITNNISSHLTKVYISLPSLYKRKIENGVIPCDQLYLYKYNDLNKLKYWVSFGTEESIEAICEWVLMNIPNYSLFTGISRTTISIPNLLDKKIENPALRAAQTYKARIYKGFEKPPYLHI